MNKKRISRRTLLIFTLIIAMTFSLCGCFEGYVSSDDAKILRDYITPEELDGLTRNPDDSIWIIDVRPAAQYDLGHIPTALSYPSTEILSRLYELPLDQYLIFYCESGVTAQSVIKDLEDNGYTLMMNWGSITRWSYPLETGS